MHGRVERHFDVLRRSRGRTSAGGVRDDGRRHRRRRSRRRRRRSTPRSPPQLRAAATRPRACAWASTPVRSSAPVDDFRGRPSIERPGSWRLGHGGQILLSDVTAALVRTGPNPVDLARPRHAPICATSPSRSGCGRSSTPTCGPRLPPGAAASTASNNLPIPRSSLVGRERQVARVVELLGRHRLVTLTGVGGVGKTRLAVQVAAELLARFAEVWFVDLADVSPTPMTCRARSPVSLGRGTAPEPLAAARAVLATKPTLLVLDNCEHVVDAAATTVDSLLDRVSASCR